MVGNNATRTEDSDKGSRRGGNWQRVWREEQTLVTGLAAGTLAVIVVPRG